MALRVGLKINRFLKLINRYKLQNVNQPYSQNSKPKYVSQQMKLASTLTNTQLEANEEEKASSVPVRHQNSFVVAKKCLSDIPVITSNLKNTAVSIHRKFAKSSTHNAITKPLKLPRLANPFPEPVKSLPSDTVSDDEKARMMQEQVKMEARFYMQMHQEMLLENKQNRVNNNRFEQQDENDFSQQMMEENQQNYPSDNSQQNQYSYSFQEDNKTDQQMNHSDNFQHSCPQENLKSQMQTEGYSFQEQHNPYQQQIYQPPSSMFHQQTKQPTYRKPKEYTQLLEQNQQENIQKSAINTTEKNVEDKKENRPRHTRCRKKSHTRAARYLRNTWQSRQGKNQSRHYSTSVVKSFAIEPTMMSEMEQCEMIIHYLKNTYPRYKNLEKPFLIPGSEEEKRFIKVIFELNERTKSKMLSKRNLPPFPSYSEMKIHKSDENTKIYSDFGSKLAEKSENHLEDSSKNNFETSKNYKRQEAPYPSYSEVYDEYDLDLIAKNAKNTNATLSKSKPDNKYYSTSTRNSSNIAKSGDLEKQAKRKPAPCKSPFPSLPRCDYEETARKKKEKKRKKHCPKKKKKGKSASEDSSKIIFKIKKWLSSYKPEEDAIKVIRSPVDVDGRETYVIEVNELEEIGRNKQKKSSINNEIFDISPEIVEIEQRNIDLDSVFPLRKKMPFKNLEYKPVEYKESHIPEITDPIPVLTKIPGFSSFSDNNKVNKPPLASLIDMKTSKVKKEVKNVKEVKGMTDNCPVLLPVVVPPTPSIVPFIAKEINLEAPLVPPKAKEINLEAPVVTSKAKELNLKEMEQKIEASGKEVQKLKEIFSVKNKNTTTHVNMVNERFQIKPKLLHAISESRENVRKEPKLNETKNDKISRFKSLRESKNQKKKVVENKIYKFKNFQFQKLTDILNKEFLEPKSQVEDKCSSPLPEPCPIITRKLPAAYCAPKKRDCNNSAVKDGCKRRKNKPGECPPTPKCRYKKKRKVPNCEDVKDNKNRCMPNTDALSIPIVERKSEYLSNGFRKTYIKKSNNLSRFINLKPDDVNALAIGAKQDGYQPFKLKPQFWKK